MGSFQVKALIAEKGLDSSDDLAVLKACVETKLSRDKRSRSSFLVEGPFPLRRKRKPYFLVLWVPL